MKKDFFSVIGYILLSFVLWATALFISLQFGKWGEFNTQPPEKRPPVSEAFESKRELGIAFYLAVFPMISLAVGTLAGRTARRPAIVAVLGVLPLQLFQLRVENLSGGRLSVYAISSLLADCAIAAGIAIIVCRRVASGRVMSSPGQP